MRDKRPVDELSIEELERILAVKKREQRIARSERYRNRGRVLETPPQAASTLEEASATQHVSEADAVEAQVPEQLPATVANNGENNLPQPYGNTDVAPLQTDEDFATVGFVDDMPRHTDPSEFWKRVASWGLLALEIVAVLALGYVLFRGFTGLEEIRDNTDQTQQELSAAQSARSSTSTPVPDISPYQLVIPGGHVYDPSNPSFNRDELEQVLNQNNIPRNQRSALVQRAQVRNISYDTPPRPSDPVLIDIPSIGLNRSTIDKGADWATLQAGLGWFQNGADLSSGGNIVIIGHNDIYGELFRELPSLEPGDEITLQDSSGREYTYRVTFEQQVEPDAVQVLDRNSGADLTLITCYPYRVNTHRWIVYAEQVR